MKRQPNRPILITDAARSQHDQLRSRQTRYITMMSARVVCLLVGGILISARAPMLWLWLTMCAVGMVVLPWLAVIIANDRPAKEQHRLLHRMRQRRAEQPEPRTLPAQPTGRTIDPES